MLLFFCSAVAIHVVQFIDPTPNAETNLFLIFSFILSHKRKAFSS